MERSHLVLVLASYLLTLQSTWTLPSESIWNPTAFLVAAGTLAVYRFAAGEKTGFFISIASCLLISPWVPFPELVFLAGLAIPALLYPGFRVWGCSIPGLRRIPCFKTFLISGIWTWATMSPEWLSRLEPLPGSDLALRIGERFFFVFAISMSFDIRDAEADQRAGLQTLALAVGKSVAYGFSLLALAISGGFSLAYEPDVQRLVPVLGLAFLLLGRKHWNEDWFYGVMLDGSLFLLLGFHGR